MNAQNILPVVTIDGPGGSGKGTVSQLLAERLGWNMLDSGALYRLLAQAAITHGVEISNAEALEVLAAHLDVQFVSAKELGGDSSVILEGEDVSRAIRTEVVGNIASQIAALPVVREALLQRQRAFLEEPGLVADGRDMGTVVFPQAPLKIYLTASAEERAQRRYKQLKEKGESVSLAALLEDIQERDDRDINRSTAPLKPADDAVILDSTSMSIAQVLDFIVKELGERKLN